MKYILLLFIILGLCRCKNVERGIVPPNVPRPKDAFKQLFTRYKPISFDTLKVYSSDQLEKDSFAFKGEKLDSMSIRLFPQEVATAYQFDSGYYACFRFSIDRFRTGLITRTPSDYEPSSIKLLIYDEKADSIVQYMELAELLGDAGDMFEKSSFLFKDEHKALSCFIWQQESHDNSVNDPKDTSISASNHYWLVGLQGQGIDTLSADSAKLSGRFHGWMK